uniref:ABC transporter permease n=1 Tax=Gemmiger formicilis TaxID=745368 RepID=UPI0040386F13
MSKALHAELQKARRRHDLLICLAVPVVVYLWAGAAAPTGADELANAYSALLFALPVLNAILMPIVMALIASRLWDMEVKGSTTKLLYTLQSRRSLFAGKALLGTGEVLLMVTLEMAVSILLGRVQGYTEAFPAEPFVYTGICTLAVDNPLPALCVGIVGALIGLFSAFMPPLVSYFVPWGYFVPLSCYEVSYWDQATHTVTYGLRPYNWGLLAFTVVLAAALFAAAWRMMRDKEV